VLQLSGFYGKCFNTSVLKYLRFAHEERKGSSDSLKFPQTKTPTAIGVSFVVYSVRLVRSGCSVRYVICGHTLLDQGTELMYVH
jgi:hypothetical protein